MTGPDANGWMPIESAPEKTLVLVAIEKPGYSGMSIAAVREGQWRHDDVIGQEFGGWTHWQPMPGKPEIADGR